MKRCNRCGYLQSGESGRCILCGAPLPQESEEHAKETEEKKEEGKSVGGASFSFVGTGKSVSARSETPSSKGKRKLFSFAFVGLLLDFLFGIGWFLCLPVSVVSIVKQKTEKEKTGKKSTLLSWSVAVSLLGTAFGLAFFILYF